MCVEPGKLNYPLFLENLRELSLYDEQVRLWNGPPEARMIGSFVEAVCGMFDDSGFLYTLEKRPDSIHPEVRVAMAELDKAVSQVDGYQPPMVVIESEQMERVRQLASGALALIYQVGLEADDPL